MKTSDLISAWIMEMLDRSDGNIELQRNELAQHFNVVPSQINYVITSRFSPEHGYIIESHRGGGGYIRIKRMEYSDKNARLMHIINSIGKELNQFDAFLYLKNLEEYGYIGPKEHVVMRAAVCDASLSQLPDEYRDTTRAMLLKNMLLSQRG